MVLCLVKRRQRKTAHSNILWYDNYLINENIFPHTRK